MNAIPGRCDSCWYIAATLAVVAAVGWGCEPEVEQRQTPSDRVEAVFNPDAQVVPLPNDMAMEDGSPPPIPGAEEGTAAGSLSDYMTGLAGWPRTTPVEIPFSGPLDEETVHDGSVLLVRIGDDDEVEFQGVDQVNYREADHGSTIEIVPQRAFVPGEEYAAVALRTLEDEEGNPVLASLPTYLAASENALVDEDGEPTMQSLAGDPEQAELLEQMRLGLKPVFQGLEAGMEEADPVDRDEVVSAMRWTTSPDLAAAFHPDFQEVPLPNTAALDDDGTFPEAATCHAGEESAAGALDDYLAGLSGWPDETPITVTLTGEIDTDALDEDDVQLWKQTDDGWERDDGVDVEFRDYDVDMCSGEEFDTNLLELTPSEPMESHEEYFAFVTRSAGVGEDEELIPELPMWLGLQPHELVDEEGQSTVGSLSDEQAQDLEQLRQLTQALLGEIEQQEGLGYEDLAAVFGWYTWDDTFVQFDPATQELPFPNSAVIEDGQVQLMAAAEESPRQAMFQSLNERTAFSPNAAGWIPLDGAIDEETFDDAPGIKFMNMDGFDVQGDDDIAMELSNEMGRLTFEPTPSYGAGSEMVVAMNNRMLGENGRPIQPSPFVVLLTGEHPVAEDGESLVDLLSDEDAAELEENRQDVDSQLPALGPVVFDDWGDGTEREDLVGVWTFDTEDPVEPLRERRAVVREAMEAADQLEARRGCDVDGGGCGNDPHLDDDVGDTLEDPDDSSVTVAAEHIAAVHRGVEFEAVYAENGDERVGVTVYLPAENEDGEDCEAPYDLAVAGHGFGEARHRAGLAVADELAAAACVATAAIDLPGHGGRTAGEDGPHPESTPEESGEEFFSGDLGATKQNLVDGISDLFALARIAEGEDDDSSGFDEVFEQLDDDPPVVGEVVGYVGVGAGGLVGVPFAAMEPTVQLGLVNSSGGRIGWMLQGDDEGPGELAEVVLDMLDDEEELDGAFGGGDHFETAAFGQWLFDYVDPYVFAESAVQGGLQTLAYDADEEEFGPVVGDECSDDEDCPANWECDGVDGEDRCVEYTGEVEMLVQMAEGDRTVINRSTEALAEGLGADLEETTFEDAPHGFIGVFDEGADGFDAGLCARMQAGGWFGTGLFDEAYLPDGLAAEECM